MMLREERDTFGDKRDAEVKGVVFDVSWEVDMLNKVDR